MSSDPSSEHFSQLSNPQTFNLYAYVVNDPLKYLDQLGLYADDGSGDCTDCGYSDGTGTGDGLLQDLGTDTGGGGGGTGDCGLTDPYCVNVTTDPNPPVDPNSPDPTDPCGANDGTCVNVTTNPNPPVDPDPISVDCADNFCIVPDPGITNPTDPYPTRLFGTRGCGVGGAGPTVNALDAACKAHDECYDGFRLSAGMNWGVGITPQNIGHLQYCNQNLCTAASQTSDFGSTEVVLYFMSVPYGFCQQVR